MFELEVGTRVLPRDVLAPEVLEAFNKTGQRVTAFSLTPWEEHCTECAVPACYSTCDLYSSRRDGKCRRFVRGIEIVELPSHPQGYAARIAFKRWGKVQATTSTRLTAAETAAAVERRVRRVENLVARLPAISLPGRRDLLARLARRWKWHLRAGTGFDHAGEPDCLLMEVYNPGTTEVRLSLTVSNTIQTGRPPFQELVILKPGFQSVEVPRGTIASTVDLQQEIQITLNPNILHKEEEGLTLFFGLLAFVALRKSSTQATAPAQERREGAGKSVKVAVWDLDNTVWSGTLVEDGPDQIILRDDAAAVVRELDRRGIVNSILSKNNEDDALAMLRQYGILEYFVFPKIGWREKGAYMKDLIRDFNVDATTFALIDDQEFERAQVVATNPGVRAYDSRDLMGLLDRPEFNPAQSAESASRRSFYRAEEHRVRDHESFGGEYLAFLQTCGMKGEISHPDPASFDRVQELVQRTNQLNYSGTHYTRDEITALLEDPANEAFVVSCIDKYGSYGTVGFALIDRNAVCLRDAMFSCRIQFKHVEHAMLAFILHLYRSRGATHFDARFRETKKNAAAASVFNDLGFVEVSRDGPSRTYRFDLTRRILDEGIVSIMFEGKPWEPAASSEG